MTARLPEGAAQIAGRPLTRRLAPRRLTVSSTATRARSERGVTLVEATIILMVLAALTTVIAPSIASYREDARQTAVRKDVEAIGAAVLTTLRDTGSRCLRLDGAVDCTKANRVDLLVSSGPDPVEVDTTAAADVTLPDPDAATQGTLNWRPSGNAPNQQDLIDDQLVTNGNASPYSAAGFAAGGPRMKLGWRGPYLNGPIVADPWNVRYQVNTVFLTVATNAFDQSGSPDQSQEGLREAGWNRDVIVLSAGANRIVETSFGGAATGATVAGGDDVIYVIAGSTR